MPISGPVENEELARFFNESLRTFADRVQGVFSLAAAILTTARGRGYAADLGTTDDKLFGSQPWTLQDFGATCGEPQPIVGTDGNGLSCGANSLEMLAIIRLAQWAQNNGAADPAILPLLAKFGPNPRA